MNSNFEVELLSLLKFIARLKEAKHIKNKGIINTFSFKQARNRNSKTNSSLFCVLVSTKMLVLLTINLVVANKSF